MKESAREKLFENNPGSISCEALFIVENHVQRCWLTRGFKIIAEEHKFLKFYSLAGDRSRSSSRLTINCVETKVSSEPMNFSDLMGIVDCCMGDKLCASSVVRFSFWLYRVNYFVFSE